MAVGPGLVSRRRCNAQMGLARPRTFGQGPRQPQLRGAQACLACAAPRCGAPRMRGPAGLHRDGEPNSIAPREGRLRAGILPPLSTRSRCAMPATYNILIMGASYGSLLASKLLFGGHKIHLVCLPAEADLINAEGFRVRLPVRGRKDPVVLDSRKLPGKVTAGPAAGVNPKDYDLVGLCMQEPQYRAPGA